MTDARTWLDQVDARTNAATDGQHDRFGGRMTWRTYLPHTRRQAGFRIIQLVGGRRWSLAIYLKEDA